MRPMTARAAGLVLGYVADQAFGDPRRCHPVAAFGKAAAWLEHTMYADSRMRGVGYQMVLVGGATAAAVAVERAVRSAPAKVMLTAAVTWAVLGGRSLEREAGAVNALLAAGDLDGARRRLRNLVGRDTAALSPDEVARAVIESVAENTSDAVVTSFVWGAAAGVPGLVMHRAANTLDAMVGHHNDRYERFGWAAARFDDFIGLPGSRLSGLLTVASGPDRRAAIAAWRRDARRHPSPNAGVIEASFAGALGIRLGGTNTYYGNRQEHRALMGDGRPPVPDDIATTTWLAKRVGVGAALAAAAACVLSDFLPPPPRPSPRPRPRRSRRRRPNSVAE